MNIDIETRKQMAISLIDELGGTKKVSDLFPEITYEAVCMWRLRGLPIAKEKYLRLAFPYLSVWQKYKFGEGFYK